MKKPQIKSPTSVSKKINTPKKRMVFMGLLVVVGFFIIAAVGATVQFVRNKNANNETMSKSEMVKTIKYSVDAPENKADRMNNIGASKESIDYLQKQIDISTSDWEKARLLVDASNIAFKNQQYNEALKYGQEAEKLNQNANSAAAIAFAYKGQGDSKNAANYFGKAADRSPKEPDNSRSNYAIYRSLQKNMESQK